MIFQIPPGREQQARRFLWAFIIACVLAVVLVNTNAMVPTPDFCKDVEVYSFWWFWYGCGIP